MVKAWLRYGYRYGASLVRYGKGMVIGMVRCMVNSYKWMVIGMLKV